MLHYSHAKINIGLHVLRKKDNGFHEIESIFYPIAWNDVVEAIPSSTTETEVVPVFSFFEIPKENNLVYRAWKLMHDSFGILAVRFYLWKRIPMQAGLGGGSGNAAAVLKLLNLLFELNLPMRVLQKLAEQLGSDVPFFLYNKPALVSGQGERIEALPFDLSDYAIQIVVPRTLGEHKGISTRDAYALIKPKVPAHSLKEMIFQPITTWKHHVINDFEEVIFPRFPLLRKIKLRLYEEGALYASMSGTGSAVYGIFNKSHILPSWDLNEFWVFEQH